MRPTDEEVGAALYSFSKLREEIAATLKVFQDATIGDPPFKEWRETDLREILAEEYDKIGFNALAHSVRARSDVTQSVNVALAALKRVAGKAPQ